ncbi:MAG: phosphoadenosine phosphosulfate reductase [Actinomycetota bacterium]|jgi:phosphoadenosine phosphosulfate reductase
MTTTTWTRDDLKANLAGIADWSVSLESALPGEIVSAVMARVDGPAVVTCSFEDAVLAHVAAVSAPGIDIVMIDTQYLFAETKWFAEEMRRRIDLNLRVVHPLSVQPDNLWQTDTEACCNVRKVQPLNRLLEGAAVWFTGVRRVDGPTRANAPVMSFDAARNLLKVNPLVAFSDDDMSTYETIHELPRNPLSERGYPSIGCWPCTRPVAPGEDKRAGRWAGQAKTECGLHV